VECAGTIYSGEKVSITLNLLPKRGGKLSPKSIKTRKRDEAVEIALEWLKTGVPTGRKHKVKSVELAADLPAILKAIRKADLDTEGAMSIVSALRERELIDFGITKSGPGREKFIPCPPPFLGP
jgi:hypothetical protein